MIPRRFLGGLGVVLVLGGGGRLMFNEAELVSSNAQNEGLRRKARYADSELRHSLLLQREFTALEKKAQGLRQDLSAANKSVANLTTQREQAHQRIRDLDQTVSQTRGELSQARSRVSSLDKQIASERERIRGLQVKLTRSEDSLRRQERQLEANQDKIYTLERRVGELDGLAQQRRRLNEQLHAKQAQLAREKEQLEERNGDLQQEIENLEGDLAQLQQRIDRGTKLLDRLKAAGVNVARLSGQRPMPQIQSIVVSVDSESVPPLVLLDAGKNKGLEVKDELYVIRSGQLIARLSVEEVRDQISSARLVLGTPGIQIQPGDQIRSRFPNPQ